MQACNDIGHLESLLRVIAPNGSLVAVYYFLVDESGTDDGSPMMSLGGYLFKQNQAVRFAERWSAYLDEKRLPYFRTSDCAHGVGVFEDRSIDDRIEAQSKLIELLKLRATMGIGVSVSKAIMRKTFDGPWDRIFGDTYVLLLKCAMGAISLWAEGCDYHGPVHYFTEAGHSSGKFVVEFLREIETDPEIARAYRYAAHSWVKKQGHSESPLIHAADLIAWRHHKFVTDHSGGKRRPRADFLAMQRGTPHRLNHLGASQLWAMGAQRINLLRARILDHLEPDEELTITLWDDDSA